MTENIFDLCKAIPAYQVAQQQGIKLRKRGERYWARCAFGHTDKTPSLVFFADGGFKCFSCGAGGSDAVSFLSQLKNVPPLVAATQLTGQPAHYTPRTQPSEYQKNRDAERWRHEKRLDLLDIQADANAAMQRRVEAVGATDALMDDDTFTTALSAYWWSENALQLLDRLAPETLYRLGLVV